MERFSDHVSWCLWRINVRTALLNSSQLGLLLLSGSPHKLVESVSRFHVKAGSKVLKLPSLLEVGRSRSEMPFVEMRKLLHRCKNPLCLIVFNDSGFPIRRKDRSCEHVVAQHSFLLGLIERREQCGRELHHWSLKTKRSLVFLIDLSLGKSMLASPPLLVVYRVLSEVLGFIHIRWKPT